MTPKERLTAVFSGKVPDRVPFAPFAELIPRADFERRLRSRGMGIIQHESSVRERNGDPTITYSDPTGGKKIVTSTPLGDVWEYWSYKDGISNDGFVQTQYMIKEDSDYPKAVAHLDGLSFSLDESAGKLTEYYLGQEGLAHAWTFEPPYMGAQYYLGYEKWVYDQLDAPKLFLELLRALSRVQKRRMELVLKAPERLVNIGNLAGNFSPEEFEARMLPYLQFYGKELIRLGKWPTIHADASNLRQFAKVVAQTGVKIIEAFTPPPVGDLSLADARKEWGEDTTIWINFPEIILQEGYEQTRAYTRELLQSDPCPNKLIGFTEMGFVGASAQTAPLYAQGMQAILDAIEECGVYEA